VDYPKFVSIQADLIIGATSDFPCRLRCQLSPSPPTGTQGQLVACVACGFRLKAASAAAAKQAIWKPILIHHSSYSIKTNRSLLVLSNPQKDTETMLSEKRK
jgi:hypothetical protein